MRNSFHLLPHLHGDCATRSRASIECNLLSQRKAMLHLSNDRLGIRSLLRHFCRSRHRQSGLGHRMRCWVRLRALHRLLSWYWRIASLVKVEYRQRRRWPRLWGIHSGSNIWVSLWYPLLWCALGMIGQLTRYALAGRTAEERKPIAPMKEKMAEWRPRLKFYGFRLVAEYASKYKEIYLLK